MCDPELFKAIGAVAQGGGTLLNVSGRMQAGRAAEEGGIAARSAAEFEAAQAEVRAGQERAKAQRESATERKKEKYLQSKLIARAAASGAGASDPTVNKLARDIAEEGELRAMTALYEGEAKARGYQDMAALSRFKVEQAYKAGKVKKGAYRTSAVTSLLSGAGSMFTKYGERPTGGMKEVKGLPWLSTPYGRYGSNDDDDE